MSQQWIYTIVYLAWLAGAVLLRAGPPSDELAGHRPERQPAERGRHGRRGRRDVRLTRSPVTGGLSGTAIVIIVVGFLIGGGAGLYAARTVKMTAMPQLVSLFNAVGGGAAALVAIDDFIRLNSGAAAVDTTIFVVLGALIGSVTFTGSLIAGGKLQGLIPGKPIYVPGGQLVTIALAVVAVLGTIALILGAAGALTLGSSATLALLGVVVLAGLIFGDHDGPAHRRRRHAGRHQPPELVHRHGGGDGRLRPRQPGADHRGRPRRCVGRDPDQAHGRRHEPLDHEHHGRRLRWRRRRGRRGHRRRRHGPRDRRRRRRDPAGVRPARDHRAGLRPGGRPGPARRARAGRAARDPRASTSSTRSTPSPAGCRAT